MDFILNFTQFISPSFYFVFFLLQLLIVNEAITCGRVFTKVQTGNWISCGLHYTNWDKVGFFKDTVPFPSI